MGSDLQQVPAEGDGDGLRAGDGASKVCSERIFRLLRPLCMDLPFKLSLYAK